MRRHACPVRVAFCSGFMLGCAAAQTCRNGNLEGRRGLPSGRVARSTTTSLYRIAYSQGYDASGLICQIIAPHLDANNLTNLLAIRQRVDNKGCVLFQAMNGISIEVVFPSLGWDRLCTRWHAQSFRMGATSSRCVCCHHRV